MLETRKNGVQAPQTAAFGAADFFADFFAGAADFFAVPLPGARRRASRSFFFV